MAEWIHGGVNPLIRVKTVKPDKEAAEATPARKWGVAGRIVGHSNTHDVLCYGVLHDDGSIAYYEPHELVLEDPWIKLFDDQNEHIVTIQLTDEGQQRYLVKDTIRTEDIDVMLDVRRLALAEF